jgi:chorismate dehydratase
MTRTALAASTQTTPRMLRVASVSYFNAKPLIYGLEEQDDLQLLLDVPSRLIDRLRDGEADVALLPVIDYQRTEGLRIVPSGAIGCDGPTLTVRIFSRVPVERIRTLACDTDSHTSVALARVVLAERLRITPAFHDLASPASHDHDAVLLIGDKVVCEEPAGYAYQLDLGQAWKELTGLPFVFAIWVAREGVELGDLPRRLEQARHDGLRHASELVARHAVPRGWPAGVAMQYITVYLKYDVAEPQLTAMRRFFELAAKHGLIYSPVKPLRIIAGGSNA